MGSREHIYIESTILFYMYRPRPGHGQYREHFVHIENTLFYRQNIFYSIAYRENTLFFTLCIQREHTILQTEHILLYMDLPTDAGASQFIRGRPNLSHIPPLPNRPLRPLRPLLTHWPWGALYSRVTPVAPVLGLGFTV